MVVREAGPPLVSQSDPPWSPRVGSALGHVAIALATLLLTLRLLGGWLPIGEHAELGAKLAELERRSSEVDTLFLGSSLTYRHVDPAAFDAATAAAGMPTHSFNLGAPGMGAVELSWALEQLAELELPRLRWVLLDPYSAGWELPDENAESPRVVAWHDARHTALALRLVEQAGLPRERRLSLWRNHLRAFATRVGLLGRLREALEPALLGDAASRAAAKARELADARRALGPAGNGFLSLDDALTSADAEERAPLLARAAALAEGEDAWRAALAHALRQPPGAGRASIGEPGPATRALLVSLSEACAALGASLIVFDAPDPAARQVLFHQAQASGAAQGAIALADPRRYPELFRFERHFDRNHFDAEGAAAFSARLAEGFLALEVVQAAGAAGASGGDPEGGR